MNLFKITGVTAALGAAAFWTTSASAVPCVSSFDDAYFDLTTSGSATVQCWDSGDQPNPGHLPVSESGPGTFNDDILNVPTGHADEIAKSDGFNSSFFNVLTGSLTSGEGGTFTVNATGSLALLFKSGGGQNTPSWWLYAISGLSAGEVFTWDILGVRPINGLSHVAAYGGESTHRIPEPTTSFLLGSGLILLSGLARRRTKKSAA